MDKNYNGTSFLNRFMDKEPVRTAEEEDFIKNGGEVKSYKVSKEEIDVIIAEMMDRKSGCKMVNVIKSF